MTTCTRPCTGYSTSATPPAPGSRSASPGRREFRIAPVTGAPARVEVRRGAYADSVTLMQVSRAVATGDGVDAAHGRDGDAAQPGDPHRHGLRPPRGRPERHGDRRPGHRAAATSARRYRRPRRRWRRPRAADRERRTSPPRRCAPPALRCASSDAGLVLVSVPGPHAFVEAMDALHAGRDVMVFSDNVPVAQEVALKIEAERRDLLVLGPDCGTAIVGGLGLGFANAVLARPGGGRRGVGDRVPAADLAARLGGGRDHRGARGGRP